MVSEPPPRWSWGDPDTHVAFRPPPTRRAIRTALVVAFAAVAVLAGGVGDLIGRSQNRHSSPPAGVTATSPLSVQKGRRVFRDDFRSPTSGWTTNPLPSGTTFAYTPAGYVVVSHGSGIFHFALAPFQEPLVQTSTSVTATEGSGAVGNTGFGVACFNGIGATQVQYVFTDRADGQWVIDREIGQPSTTNQVVAIDRGSTPNPPGTRPVTVTGVCATLSDGANTRLTLFIGSDQVANLADKAPLDGTGWLAALATLSGAGPTSTVTATDFAIRDLGP